MSDQYNFVWSDPTLKPGFTVLPQATDTTDSPLTLVGRGTPNWGQGLQQNLLYMVESWANSTPPNNPTTGQTWYNTSTQRLYVYDASLTSSPSGPWVPAGSSTYTQSTAPANPQSGSLWVDTSVTGGVLYAYVNSTWQQIYPNQARVVVAGADEYNAMVAIVNQILGTPTGTSLATAYGWNQTNTFATKTAATITNADWISLLTEIQNICNYLGISTTGLSLDGFIYAADDTTIQYGISTMLSKYSTSLAIAQNLLTGTVRFVAAPSSLESQTPAGGTQTRTTAWSNTITHVVTVQFASVAMMDGFFNAGGKIQFIPSLANPGTGRDFDVQAFLAARGTVTFSALNTYDSSNNINVNGGFYNVSSVNAQIFGVAGNPSDPYGQDKYAINAVFTSSNTIQFQIQYTSTGTLYGGVGGTLTSKTTIVRPASTKLSTPVISWPTVTQSASIV